MPPFGPIPRRRLLRYLRQFGYDGPFPGGNHEYMRRADGVRLTIPNPHQGDIGQALLGRILRQAGISREEWEEL
jgi:predicted RNA binding protein YcfA (HicA-like mRNA interferase family)